ncbi:hypothetical protein [Luteimonas sp. e5]
MSVRVGYGPRDIKRKKWYPVTEVCPHSPYCIVWFPPNAWYPRIVAHEAVHVAVWAMKLLGNKLEAFEGIVPPWCESWNMKGPKRRAHIREEAMARIIDNFVNDFYVKAAKRRLWTGLVHVE